MLHYQNGRFDMGKASFILPDGFYVESDIDLTEGSGFCAWDPERKYLFRWRCFRDCEGPAEELKKWFLPDVGLIPLSEITPVAVNGLTGHGVLYHSRVSEYCEARFDLGEGEQLVLMVESRVEKAKDILSSDAFQAVWKGLQGAKPEI